MRAIPHIAILADLTSDDVLDTAYDWLCRRRRAYSADADVWSFRQRWPAEKKRLMAELATGRFRFGLLPRVILMHGEEAKLSSSLDTSGIKSPTPLWSTRQSRIHAPSELLCPGGHQFEFCESMKMDLWNKQAKTLLDSLSANS